MKFDFCILHSVFYLCRFSFIFHFLGSNGNGNDSWQYGKCSVVILQEIYCIFFLVHEIGMINIFLFFRFSHMRFRIFALLFSGRAGEVSCANSKAMREGFFF